MICGDKNGRQVLMNGLPSQLCEDCIEIQKEMYNSEPQEICDNWLHPIISNVMTIVSIIMEITVSEGW